MDKAAILAKLKCKIVSILTDEKIENDYMITCASFEDRDLKIKEYSLLINLLENSDYINYEDACEITKGCDFSKIKELNNAY